MKKLISAILCMSLLAGCATSTKDLAKTLRYSDNRNIEISNIAFKQLSQRQRGDACTWNLFFVIPLYGDGSIITAAKNGDINNVEMIGETGYWFFPFNKNCTVVFGNKNAYSPQKPQAEKTQSFW